MKKTNVKETFHTSGDGSFLDYCLTYWRGFHQGLQ